MAYTIANSAEETEKVFIEKNEKNNLTNAWKHVII
jgi:hypothetical protein